MTRIEHIEHIRKLASELNPEVSWNDLLADTARIRGACMGLMVELHTEYIRSIPSHPIFTPIPQPKLTVDDL